MSELRLCPLSELVEGEPRRIHVTGHTAFCAYLVDGAPYVSDNACTHGSASLGEEGELDGFTIICTWHNGAFDIRTGEVIEGPCYIPLKVYPASIRDGEVWITLDS